MNEVMLEAAGYFDEPPDCQHDWRIEFTIDDERNGFYQARCMQCPQTAPPDVMNGVVEILEAENDALGKMLSEHVDMLAARDKRIEELEDELAKAKDESEGWFLQVKVAKEDLIPRLKELEAELARVSGREG